MNTDYISSDVARALGSRVLPRFFRVSVGEASQILDLGRRKIHLFIEQGVVVPSASAPGTGTRRQLDFRDLVLLKVAPPPVANRILHQVRKHNGRRVATGGGVFLFEVDTSPA